MIDMLTSPLPDCISVEGEEYQINTDFRVWIKTENILSDASLSLADKIIRIFALVFIDKIPADIEKAVSAIGQFLSPFPPARGKQGEKNASPLFSFSSDGGFIYAAFLSQYGIDLTSACLHWWRFLSLFLSLNACKFTEIVKIRGLKLSDIGDSEQKRLLRQLKRIYRLPSSAPDIGSEIAKLI